MDFHFLVWSPLHAYQANSVTVFKTSEALARLAPDWRIHLYSSEPPEEGEDPFATLGIERLPNLSFETIFQVPGTPLTHVQTGEVINNDPRSEIQELRRRCMESWRKRLAAGPSVVYTRNARIVDFFREINVPGVPLLIELHQLKYSSGVLLPGMALGEIKTGLRASREREFGSLRKADMVYCISNPLAGRIAMIDPSIRTELLRCGVTLPKSLHEKTDDGRDIDLLYSGQLYTWKGVHTVIEALRYLPESIRLTVVGGNDARTVYMAKKTAANWGVNHRIDWVGQVPHKKVAEYQRRAKIGLVPLSRQFRISRWYTSPIKVFELIAAGATLLVADLLSLRDILVPGKTAEFARPDDPRAWAEKIEFLLANDAYRRELADNARVGLEEFSFEARTRRIIAGVNKLMGEGAAR